MKKIFLSIILLLFLASCSNSKNNFEVSKYNSSESQTLENISTLQIWRAS